MKNIILLFFAFTVSLSGQTVTTISDGFLEDGMALDTDGNLYVAHFSGDKVFKISPTGDVSPFITGLNTPNGLAFDNDENLFVCDWQANTIFKYDSTGNLLDSYGTTGNPSGITKAFDGNGMIFTHYTSNKLSRLDSTGAISLLSSAALLNGPVGIVYDESGALFVGNYNNRNIYKVHPNDSLEYIARPPGTGSLPNLGFLTYSNEKLYGTIISSHKIYEINPNAVDDFSIFAGTTLGNTDGDLSIAKFNQPNGLIFNTAGDVLYIAEFGSKNLRIISGILTSNKILKLTKTVLNVLPNPAGDTLIISTDLSDKDNYSLEIYNVSGQKMFDFSGVPIGSKVKKILDISSWSNGTYLIRLTVDGRSITEKLIKM